MPCPETLTSENDMQTASRADRTPGGQDGSMNDKSLENSLFGGYRAAARQNLCSHVQK